MTQESRSVRQWQSQYRAAAFESKDLQTQLGAGWRGFSCRSDALPGRLRQMAPAVTRIQASFILDHYTLWFENIKCLNRKAVYDCVRFQPLDTGREGLSFRLDFKNPDEPKKWALYTDRYGPAAPEYGCAGAFEMSRYINTMAHELELGVQPEFLLEKQAVAAFLQERTGRAYTAVYREGDHLYSCYLDTPRNPMSKRFLAAYTPETLPPDIQGKGMEQIGNVFVFYSGAVDPVLSQRTAQTKRRYKRKEVER